MATSVPRQDVVDILIADHREVEEMFVELESGLGDNARRRQVADVLIAELVRHSVAEEAYVYPTARKVLPDGERLAEHEIAEHAEAEQLMKELESADADDPQFARLVSQLASTIRHHVQEEEANLFPALRNACEPDELRRLGERVEAAKKIAPTRPHPAAPDRPPLNKLLAPGAGLVDRVRDALTGRATTPEDL